jgi:hypothetical protein
MGGRNFCSKKQFMLSQDVAAAASLPSVAIRLIDTFQNKNKRCTLFVPSSARNPGKPNENDVEEN